MDRRRVNGPELSVAPLVATVDAEGAVNFVQETPKQAFTPDTKRQDGRSAGDIRPIYLRAGLVNQASGSAYFEQKNTRVTCGVYGPRQNKKAQFNELARLECEIKFTPSSCEKRRALHRDPEEKELANFIAQALSPAVKLDRYPKSTISVYISVIQCDGWWSAVAAAITCASVALIDAGIDMIDSVVAASTLVANPSTVLMDASQSEEDAHPHIDAGVLLVAELPTFKSITHVVQMGKLDINQTTKATEACLEVCAKIHGVVNHYLRESVIQQAEI
ncbi:3'-5'-exoribonuclease [Dimargaris cristalligena]|uniref:Ribosomal protein S5 domain 2-type protein n=1 Tax=Dimargaris cristalligena TaxID=215637 RepID=A0A4P9ZR00_9FUNG|nr:3'-5'-exoribonuclease [Dimargaris cristalligena]RKP35568.1 ribosomal protein S5 domain 2-type protein [Dimargaris cristalligena]|eukprot:RKP35568.1 ribosomal protein S5 domain 2-type protein [Dimargaris cristalligena]